jgi:hypothetical protein
MEWLVNNYGMLLQIVGAVVTCASTIVALTPSTKDDEILGKVVKFFEYFSVFNKKTK